MYAHVYVYKCVCVFCWSEKCRHAWEHKHTLCTQIWWCTCCSDERHRKWMQTLWDITGEIYQLNWHNKTTGYLRQLSCYLQIINWVNVTTYYVHVHMIRTYTKYIHVCHKIQYSVNLQKCTHLHRFARTCILRTCSPTFFLAKQCMMQTQPCIHVHVCSYMYRCTCIMHRIL